MPEKSPGEELHELLPDPNVQRFVEVINRMVPEYIPRAKDFSSDDHKFEFYACMGERRLARKYLDLLPKRS